MNYIYIFNDLLTAWACLIYISLAPYCLVYFQFHSSLNFMWSAVTEYVRSPSITFVLRCIWERKKWSWVFRVKRWSKTNLIVRSFWRCRGQRGLHGKGEKCRVFTSLFNFAILWHSHFPTINGSTINNDSLTFGVLEKPSASSKNPHYNISFASFSDFKHFKPFEVILLHTA